jgi:apolipoprotein D and lipocalin family protein
LRGSLPSWSERKGAAEGAPDTLEAGMRRVLLVCAIVAVGVTLGGCGHAIPEGSPSLRTVAKVDLERYLGLWYEIARYPHRFQEGCTGSRATYTRLPDGRIRVENACRDARDGGAERRATGVAWVAPGDPSNAKLLVQFFWPFRGEYWIIELDPDYRFAVVGHPSRDYLWILSRTPRMDEGVYRELLRRIATHGYDLTRIRLTEHPPA